MIWGRIYWYISFLIYGLSSEESVESHVNLDILQNRSFRSRFLKIIIMTLSLE